MLAPDPELTAHLQSIREKCMRAMVDGGKLTIEPAAMLLLVDHAMGQARIVETLARAIDLLLDGKAEQALAEVQRARAEGKSD